MTTKKKKTLSPSQVSRDAVNSLKQAMELLDAIKDGKSPAGFDLGGFSSLLSEAGSRLDKLSENPSLRGFIGQSEDVIERPAPSIEVRNKILQGFRNSGRWGELAAEEIHRIAKKEAGSIVLAEDLRVILNARIGSPQADLRCWGGLMQKCRKLGIVSPAGLARARSSHNTRKVAWRLNSVEGTLFKKTKEEREADKAFIIKNRHST